MSLLQMSLYGAVLILVIVVIRAIAINKLPKKIFLVFWGIAIARLLLPVSFPSVFSFFMLNNTDAPVLNLIEKGIFDLTTEVLPNQQIGVENGATQFLPNNIPTVSILFLVWITGMLLVAGYFLVSYTRCQREFKTSLPVQNDYAEEWISNHLLCRKIEIRSLTGIATPLTYGLFHPVILIPKNTNWENKRQIQYMLFHEYVHICHFDAVGKLIVAATLCVHWFNPMVWVLYILFNRDIELACDECVLRHFGGNDRAEYARTLICMEEQQFNFAPFYNHFAKIAIEERIEAIMMFRKKSTLMLVLALMLIVVGTTTAFATSTNAQPKQANSVEQDGKIEIVTKPDSVPQITENAGVFFKDDGTSVNSDTNGIQMANPVQSNDIYGTPIEKTDISENDLLGNNIIYFDTEAERDEHFRALEANTEKGLDRYAGFEAMYEGIDTSAPVTYIVK